MKPCPFCAEPIQDQAIKCRYCNSMLEGSPANAPEDNALEANVIEAQAMAASPSPPNHALGPSRSPNLTSARPFFEGAPSWKSWFGSYVLAALLLLLPLALVWLGVSRRLAWNGVIIGSAALVTVSLTWAGMIHLLRRSIRYRISIRTLDTEAGILSKHIQTLQLWRIRDLDFRQSFIERLLGIANIHVSTKDVSDPDLVLRGLPASRDLFDQLKEAAELARQQRVVGLVE